MNGKKARALRKEAQQVADVLELPEVDYYVRKSERYVKQFLAVINLKGQHIMQDYTVQTVRLQQCQRSLYKALKKSYSEASYD